MRFDDVVNLLGSHRDNLILALAVLVLVEGGIIVLWARRAVRLRRELVAVAATAEAARVAAERAADQVASRPAVRREVYSVAARAAGAASAGAATSADESPAALSVSEVAASPSTPEVAASAVPPATPLLTEPAAPAVLPETVAQAERAAPAALSAPAAPVAAEPPAEYVSPAAAQAAAWVLPEVAATNGNGNGHHAAPAPTTLGWPESPMPVEPAADFAVVSEPAASTAPEPSPAQSPNLTVLDGTRTWSFPAAATPVPAAPVPTHFDPAMFDSNDDLVDDGPVTGDVLLVEDDATIAKLYRVLLESRGYTVRHAADGLEGLDRANEKRPDLVLLDIMMPRMNGIAFLQALRSGEMRDVPVVVLSNFMEKQLVDDAMSLGALEYMVKAQTRPEALVGALPHWLRGERAFSF